MGKMITSRQLAEIKRRNANRENDAQIGRALGIPSESIRKYRVAMGLPRAGRNKKQRAYTVWDAKTDELIAYGSAEECTTALGFARVENFYTMVSRVKSGEQKNYSVLVEVV